LATAEEISRSYWQAEMRHDVDAVMEHFRPDAVLDLPGVHLEGDEIRTFYEESFKAFPKLEHEVTRVMGDERLACLEWHAALTDAEGKRFEFQGVNLAEVDGERFITVRGYFDRKDLDIAAESNL
jgi:predicted ester cyclase